MSNDDVLPDKMPVAFTVFIIFAILAIGIGVTHSLIKADAAEYDKMEFNICNDMKALAGQFQKITAVDYHKNFYRDQCVIYVDKKEYDAHEFIRLVGLEEISILDAEDKENAQ